MLFGRCVPMVLWLFAQSLPSLHPVLCEAADSSRSNPTSMRKLWLQIAEQSKQAGRGAR